MFHSFTIIGNLMKIGIDARCLQESQKTGVAEYAIGVFKHIFLNNSQDEFILFLNSFHEIDSDLEWLTDFSNVSIKRFYFPNKLINLSFWLLGWPKVDKMVGGVDVFFMPNSSFIALSNYCKKIITIHDLSFERFPETFSFKRRLWHFMVNSRNLCRKSDQIWAVSESTKQDLEFIYKIDPEKISVSFPPFDHQRFLLENLSQEKIKKIKNKYNIPFNFILFIGTIEPRKNIESLIKAFGQLKKENPIKLKDLKLVIAGGSGWLCQDVLREIGKSLVKDDIILTGFVDDEEKPFLYNFAKVFVYPSIFEGFGYPPIEAMAAGTPTITSNCSSIPEVVGDSAILIDPYCPYEITIALQQLLFDKELYQYYSEKGKKRAREVSNIFRTWEIEVNMSK